MDNFKNIENELNFDEEWFKNFKLKTPSYYHIECYVDKLYEIVENYKSNTEACENDLISIRQKIYILKEDLAGVLKSDYKKTLVRYREKWIDYHQAIDKVKKHFLDVLKKDVQ